MKATLIALRIVETVFLAGIVFTYTVSPYGVDLSFNVLSALCNFSVVAGADQIVISSVIFGYVISLVATMIQWSIAKRALRVWSLALAILGIAACGNEIGRYVFGYSFQVLVHAPIALVIVDWFMIVPRKDQAAEFSSADPEDEQTPAPPTARWVNPDDMEPAPPTARWANQDD